MSDPVQSQFGVGSPLSGGLYGPTTLMRAPTSAAAFAGSSGWKYAAIAGLALMLQRDVLAAMASGWTPTSVPAAARMGFVATGCGATDTITGGGQLFWMTRTAHVATDDLSLIQVCFPNFWSSGGGSIGTAAINATIEYNGLIQATLTFAGATTGTVANNSVMWSDFAHVAIPKGATFYVREHRVQGGGATQAPVCQGGGNNQQPALGECTNGATTAVTDLTASVGTFANTQNNIPRPLAIIGMTANPSILIVGDSRADGTGDSAYNGRGAPLARVGTGNIEPALTAGNLGYCRLALTGTQVGIGGWQAGSQQLSQLLFTLATHVISDMGINDLNTGGQTAAALMAAQSFLAGLNPSAKFYCTTLGPVTTSTDSWATLANQTKFAGDAQRVAYNSALRAGNLPPGAAGYFDVASLTESSPNSGLWTVNGTANYATGDGVHGGSVIYDAVVPSGIITPNSLSR